MHLSGGGESFSHKHLGVFLKCVWFGILHGGGHSIDNYVVRNVWCHAWFVCSCLIVLLFVEPSEEEQVDTTTLPRETQQCLKILDELRGKQQIVEPFLMPVDTKEYPTYTNVVKEPMDLGTIAKKLKRLVYVNRDAFRRDVMLVWENARRFNPPGHKILHWVEELESLFLQRCGCSNGIFLSVLTFV